MNYTGPSAKPHDSGVAIAIIVVDNGKVLLMKRKGGSTGVGEWSIPGGGVEYMEDPLDAARRELHEETGLLSNSFEMVGYSNDTHHKEKLHYVTFTFFARNVQGVARIAEPRKCSEIGWFSVDALPSPLFKPTAIKLSPSHIKALIRQH